MVAKNTLSIMLRNLNLIVKMIVFMAIMFVLIATVLLNVFSPVIKLLLQYLSLSEIGIDDFSWSRLFSNLGNSLQIFVSDNTTEIIKVCTYTYLVIFVSRFFISLVFLPLSSIIGVQMTTNYTDKFVTAFVQTFKKSIGYSFFSSLITLLFDLPFSVLFIFITILLAPTFKIFALSTGLILFVLYMSVRIAMTSQWLPHIVLGEKKVLVALIDSLKEIPRCFPRLFLGTLCIMVTIFTLSLAAAIPTFFSALVAIIPCGMVLLCTHTMVTYCEQHDQNYFIDPKTIVTVKEAEEVED